MKRREFLGALGGAAALWPIAGRAQPKPLRVGAVHFNDVKSSGLWGPIDRRFHELNYVEGVNIAFDFVELKGQADHYPEAMKELVRRQVDVIITLGPEIALKSAIAATDAIPIVMVALDFDPLKQGYVKSLSRPSGNVTGVFFQQIELALKRMQLLQEACPGKAMTVFWDRVSTEEWQVVQSAAKSVGENVIGVELSERPYDYEKALMKAPPDYQAVLSVLSAPAFFPDRKQLAEIAIRHKTASMFSLREFADAGGLMSYGANIGTLSRLAADYVNRIARGAKPEDLPIEQPTKFEFVVNSRTAKAIGLDLPPGTLLRADEVIE